MYSSIPPLAHPPPLSPAMARRCVALRGRQVTLRENLDPQFTEDYTTDTMQTFSIVFGVLFNGCTMTSTSI